MDGKLAVLFALISGADATLNRHTENYWESKTTQSYLATSVGQTWVSTERNTQEVGLDYLQPNKLAMWQPTLSMSLSKRGGFWLGYGATITKSYDLNHVSVFGTSFFMPGIYLQGNDKDLGLPIEFKSGAELGLEFANKHRVSGYFSHRSNADFGNINPGMNAWHIRYQIPMQ